MEKKDGERVDTVASSAAVSNDPVMIQQWKKSTEPITKEGKAKVAQNG